MTILPNAKLIHIVASYILNNVGDLRTFNDGITRLKEVYTSSHSSEVDVNYDEFALQFLWLYYFANFSKSKLACRKLDGDTFAHDLNILDLGCGSGASIVGTLEYLEETSSLIKNKHINVTVIDHSSKQMEVFEQTSEKYLIEKFGASITLNKYKTDIRIFLKEQENLESYNIILASNVLCEVQKLERIGLIKNIVKKLSPGGFLIVIERKETGILALIEQIDIWRTYKSVLTGLHRVSGLEQMEGIGAISPLKKEFELCCGIFGLTYEEDKTSSIQGRIGELYKKAWENHDIGIIREIFHDDAEYYEKPFDEPLRGIEEITRYWKYNTERQRNVQFTILEENHYKNQVVLEWKCEFYRIDREVEMTLRGVFLAKIRDKKIKKFVEYFLRL